MSLTLHDLCAEFCALTQATLPERLEQPNGIVAYNLSWRDVIVDLMSQPSADPLHAFIVFHMGIPDPAHHDFGAILQALLKSNFVGFRANQPVFSCHPQTGSLMLQWAIPLAETSGENLRTLVEEGIELVLQWRGTYFLAAGDAPAGHATSGTHAWEAAP
jgi:hypothetical protein